LQNTIKIYICELNDINQTISVVDQVQQQLDAMECMDCFMAKESQNYLELYFDNINKSELLLTDAFGDNNINGRIFETLIEFSAQGSGKKQNELFKDSIVASLPAKYKYVAYVCADGDNAGKAIGALGVDMSNKLLAFNQEVGNKVNEKKGRVIYAGGDDLLFLSQVDSVFDLIVDIDNLFTKTILTEDIKQKLKNNNLPVPSMSYGVYISYHKHPMGEALAAAENLLSTAKKQGRNRIEFIMRKHSGQSIASFVDKNKFSLSEFVKLKNKFYTNSQENDLFLHSFSHFLRTHIDVITHLLSADTPQLLNNYFASTFNDGAHSDYKEIIKTLISLLRSLSQSVGDKKTMAINQLYAMLRYIELIISKN
jgi:CRISPR-associated protein Cmr2